MAFKKVFTPPDNTMAGQFFIIKGQYTRNLEPAILCPDKEERHIGGYNPHDARTSEWYQLVDRKNYVTTCCGGNLERVLKGFQNIVIKCGNDMDVYERNNPRYYEYEDDEKKSSKNRRVNVSRVGVWLCQAVEQHWGDYFEDEVNRAYKLALAELEESRKPKKSPLKKVDRPSPQPDKKVLKKSSRFKRVDSGRVDEELPFN